MKVAAVTWSHFYCSMEQWSHSLAIQCQNKRRFSHKPPPTKCIVSFHMIRLKSNICLGSDARLLSLCIRVLQSNRTTRGRYWTVVRLVVITIGLIDQVCVHPQVISLLSMLHTVPRRIFRKIEIQLKTRTTKID